MFSIHARNSFLQIDLLTLTAFDHFARFFFCQLFSKLRCLGREKKRKRGHELTVFEAFAHYSFCAKKNCDFVLPC